MNLKSDEEHVDEKESSTTRSRETVFLTVEMLRVDVRVGVDLKSVVVDGRVFKETVERIEHLVREEEEELSENRVKSVGLNCCPRGGKAHARAHLERPP